MTIQERLKNTGIRHYDVLIHDQKKNWLIKKFSDGADEYPVNVARLIRNIVWQQRERIISGEKGKLDELIRTFWYMYIKPTLSRAGALAVQVDQYKQLSAQIADMVTEFDLMRYRDLGFTDDNLPHRFVGTINPHIIIFSEKIGHQNFLQKFYNKFNVSIISLGGQPSLLNSEYFVEDIKKSGVNLKRSFYLFSIVDYDTSGYIIQNAFLNNLEYYGLKNLIVNNIVNPDMLSPEEIYHSRYKIPVKSMETKNKKWLKHIKNMNYKNQKYLVDGNDIYGLEAESISTKRMSLKLEKLLVPLIGQSDDLLKIYELKSFCTALKDLILFKLT